MKVCAGGGETGRSSHEARDCISVFLLNFPYWCSGLWSFAHISTLFSDSGLFCGWPLFGLPSLYYALIASLLCIQYLDCKGQIKDLCMGDTCWLTIKTWNSILARVCLPGLIKVDTRKQKLFTILEIPAAATDGFEQAKYFPSSHMPYPRKTNM